MLVGHYGLAAIVKSREPQLPLWALFLSTELLDFAFLSLIPFGIESLKNVGRYGESISSADYTHSLVGALVISLAAAVAAAIPWGRRNGLVIGAVVFSHWLLDFVVHLGNMPILPGNAGDLPRLGLGLWSIPWLSAAIELALVVVGAYLYYHASMRAAAKAERQATKADSSAPTANHRQRARIASITLFVVLIATLVGNFLGY